jgi:hypothetical protein
MRIEPNRVSRGRLQTAQETPSPLAGERPRPATPPLTPESGSTEPSPLDIARDQLIAANRRVFELESTLTSMHRLLLRKESELDELHKELAGVALVTPITGPAISALRAEKKKQKRKR